MSKELSAGDVVVAIVDIWDEVEVGCDTEVEHHCTAGQMLMVRKGLDRDGLLRVSRFKMQSGVRLTPIGKSFYAEPNALRLATGIMKGLGLC